MKRHIPVIGLILCVFISSCIPYKNTLYLQNKSAALDSTQVVMVENQKPYRVQIHDILSIRVKALDQENVQIINPLGEGNLNASSSERAYFDGFTVDLHGDIRVPTLGKIKVLGRTAEEIEQIIEEKLLTEQFKETANIFVSVKLSGLRYTTLGEIGARGTRTLFQERVNIFEAVANAGDIPITGNLQDVQIIRQYPDGQKIHQIDLTDAKVMQSPYYYIQPNDIIYVKPLKQKSIGGGTDVLQNIGSVATVISLIATSILLLRR